MLEKYNEIWDKVSNTIKKGFDSEPVYNKKYVRTKIKCYEWKVDTNIHGRTIPKGSQCIRLSVILLILFLGQVKTVILKYF